METKQEFRKQCPSQAGAILSDLDLSSYEFLLAFIPLSTEVDITPLIDSALAAGIKVAVPKLFDEFVCLKPNWRDNLYRLPNGTMCPIEGETIDPSKIKENTLMLVPGLAFTQDGKRLGRGGGFYDRLLSKLPSNVETLGICTEGTLFSDIPTQVHDKRVDRILVV